MAQESKPPEGAQVINRIFEQPPDAVSFYSDVAQVLGTGLEVVMQFYETIPGTPGPGGKIASSAESVGASDGVYTVQLAEIQHLTLLGSDRRFRTRFRVGPSSSRRRSCGICGKPCFPRAGNQPGRLHSSELRFYR